jgi:hypothetical protein
VELRRRGRGCLCDSQAVKLPGLTSLTVSVTVLLVAGCGDGKTKVNSRHPTTLALVLVDVSKSTYGKGGEERKRYAAAFRRIVDVLPDGTLLKADIIDANPLSDTSLPVSEFYEKYGGILGKKNKFQITQQHKAAAARATKEFGDLVQRRPRGDSILGALEIAQNVFDSFPSAKTKYLVIFSDMIESSSRYRFTDKNLQPKQVESFIKRERDNGDLPDLAGVEVYVVGAAATRGADVKNPAHVRAIRRFWLAYFDATHASLRPDRYGPALISFP